MWVDIMTPQEAAQYPLLDIKPTPPTPYEVRAIVWKTRGVPPGDAITQMSGACVCVGGGGGGGGGGGRWGGLPRRPPPTPRPPPPPPPSHPQTCLSRRL
jgi:hypothetical protein